MDPTLLARISHQRNEISQITIDDGDGGGGSEVVFIGTPGIYQTSSCSSRITRDKIMSGTMPLPPPWTQGELTGENGRREARSEGKFGGVESWKMRQKYTFFPPLFSRAMLGAV